MEVGDEGSAVEAALSITGTMLNRPSAAVLRFLNPYLLSFSNVPPPFILLTYPQVLANVPFLSDVPERALEWFRANGNLVRYGRGDIISTDLQGAQGLFVVVNGRP